MKAASHLAGSIGKLVAQGSVGQCDTIIDRGPDRPGLLAGRAVQEDGEESEQEYAAERDRPRVR